jgi:hypothetical protein
VTFPRLGRGHSTAFGNIRAAASDDLEEGVNRRFQGADVPLDLGEEKAALKRGEEGDGEGVRVGPVREHAHRMSILALVYDDRQIMSPVVYQWLACPVTCANDWLLIHGQVN